MSNNAKLLKIEAALNSIYPERNAFIRGLIISIIAESHLFVIGEPGTAKTEIVQTLMAMIGDAKLFDFLMMRSTTPDEVFGPIDIDAYKKGNCKRFTENTSIDADVVFLDEVFKGGSVTLNGFLRMMSQREFTNGASMVDVPLKTLIGASNELAQEDDLAAMFSRFSLRYEVKPLRDEAAIKGILFNAPRRIKPGALSLADFADARDAASAFDVSDDAKQTLFEMRAALIDKGFNCDIRRLNKLVGSRGCALAKAHCWLRGGTIVEPIDLAIIADAIWETPQQLRGIKRIVNAFCIPQIERLRSMCDALIEDFGLFKAADGGDSGKAGELLARARDIEMMVKGPEFNISGGIAGDVGDLVASIKPLKRRLAASLTGGISIAS